MLSFEVMILQEGRREVSSAARLEVRAEGALTPEKETPTV